MRKVLILVALMVTCTGCLEEKRLRDEAEALQEKCRLLEKNLERTKVDLQQRGKWLKGMKEEWPASTGWYLAVGLVLFIAGCVVGSNAKRANPRRQQYEPDSRPSDEPRSGE